MSMVIQLPAGNRVYSTRSRLDVVAYTFWKPVSGSTNGDGSLMMDGPVKVAVRSRLVQRVGVRVYSARWPVLVVT